MTRRVLATETIASSGCLALSWRIRKHGHKQAVSGVKKSYDLRRKMQLLSCELCAALREGLPPELTARLAAMSEDAA